ncbi:MAG TPA: GNAT family N-acetyltransferase [Rubrivivax sp.]|nr:GNAT family N-acetyltransferase [Rubrivivax sp.]
MHEQPTRAGLLIRPSTADDIPAFTGIYAHAVHNSTGTFELDAPDATEMSRRRDDVLAKGLPWLTAESGGEVLGYAYAGLFRPRRAYRFTLEDSIYIAPEARGRGLGRLLLAELVARCEAVGARQMLAVIGDSANQASVAVHLAQGFEPVGTFKNVGHKFGRWLDAVLMQRALGAGATTDAAP